ncbi:hypothetical protein H920_04674 [Fukomys damarensis]|uniref:Uncharacterized protein n=1 Tax=Fukomys damarensis TaxID=885580 RepID=A0A091DP38_FUKDA|nr:hypothetical protein H920_04674 [Fukomys damarensis]
MGAALALLQGSPRGTVSWEKRAQFPKAGDAVEPLSSQSPAIERGRGATVLSDTHRLLSSLGSVLRKALKAAQAPSEESAAIVSACEHEEEALNAALSEAFRMSHLLPHGSIVWLSGFVTIPEHQRDWFGGTDPFPVKDGNPDSLKNEGIYSNNSHVTTKMKNKEIT